MIEKNLFIYLLNLNIVLLKFVYIDFVAFKVESF